MNSPDNNPNLADELLTPAEAAALTGTTESGWRNKCAAGQIPGAFKKGKQWLIPRSVIQTPSEDDEPQD